MDDVFCTRFFLLYNLKTLGVWMGTDGYGGYGEPPNRWRSFANTTTGQVSDFFGATPLGFFKGWLRVGRVGMVPRNSHETTFSLPIFQEKPDSTFGDCPAEIIQTVRYTRICDECHLLVGLLNIFLRALK